MNTKMIINELAENGYSATHNTEAGTIVITRNTFMVTIEDLVEVLGDEAQERLTRINRNTVKLNVK